MPLTRLVFSSLRNHSESTLHLFRRRLFSSIHTRSGPNSVSHGPVTNQKITRDTKSLNCFEKRYYCSSTRSTSSTKPPLPFHEQTEPSITWRHLIIPGSLLAGLGGVVYFIHSNDEKRAVPKGQGEKFERSAIQGPIIGGPFSLIDTEGQLVTEKNLLGNWVLLYFGYTSSPDVGPAELRKMANAINTLESQKNLKVLPIFVTIDPQRDTPSQLRAYIREFDSKIVGLTGPVAAVRQMAQEYRVFFKKVDEEGDDYLVESSHIMYLLNPNMEVERSFGVEYSGEELAEAISKEMQKTKTFASRS